MSIEKFICKCAFEEINYYYYYLATHGHTFRPRTHGNVFLRFCIVSSTELVVLDSLENSKHYKNAGKRFRVYGA